MNYDDIHDVNCNAFADTSEKYFYNLEKRKMHLEKPANKKAARFYKKEKSSINFSHEKTRSKKFFSKIFRFMFACTFLLVFLVAFSVAMSFFDKDKEVLSFKNYDEIIWPIVMQNPRPFDENHPPDNETMIKASIWDLAMSHKNISNAWNEDNLLVLPESEVKTAGKKLFGKELNLSRLKEKNFEFYKFDSEKNEFLIEPISGTEGFLPHTVNAHRDGEDIVLKVGYVAPKNQFSKSMNKVFENKVEKFAKYRLKKNIDTGEFYVSSVT